MKKHFCTLLITVFTLVFANCAPQNSPPQAAQISEYFKVSPEKTNLFWPKIQFGVYKKQTAIPKNEYHDLYRYRCEDNPKRHPLIAINQNKILYGVSPVYDLNFNFLYSTRQVTHYRNLKTDITGFEFIEIALTKEGDELATLRHSRGYAEMTRLDTRLGYVPYVYKKVVDKDFKQDITAQFPSYNYSPTALELKELVQAGARGEIFDSGIFTMADGRSIQAYRWRSIQERADHLEAFDVLLSPEVGGFFEALCRWSRVRFVFLKMKKTPQGYQIVESPFESELLSDESAPP